MKINLNPDEVSMLEDALLLYESWMLNKPTRDTVVARQERQEHLAAIADLRTKMAIAKMPGRTRRAKHAVFGDSLGK